MRTIDASIAQSDLGTLLDAVERGAEIVIVRNGLPVARLVPAGAIAERDEAHRAAERIRALSRKATLGPDLTIKQLIDEGRP